MFVGTHKRQKHLKNLPFGWIFLRKKQEKMRNKKPDRVRPRQMKFWVTDEEKEKILKKAKGSQNLTEYLRKIALKGKVIHPVPAIDRTTFTELNRIGNNLNQISKHLNSSEANIFHKQTKKELQGELTRLNERLDEITNKLNNRKAYEIKEINENTSIPLCR